MIKLKGARKVFSERQEIRYAKHERKKSNTEINQNNGDAKILLVCCFLMESPKLPLNTMVKQSYIFVLTFICITLFYLATRWFIFLGFNGTDDLHYALLSSRILNHTFNPFVPNDIYSGRIVLLGIQSFIYRLGGISVLTTQIGTILATVASCYLTVFKIIKPKTNFHILLSCSFFYLNPVLLDATLGIMPDAYIMLLGIYFTTETKNILTEQPVGKSLQKSFFLGIFIGLALLIKEIAILFIVFSVILVMVYNPKRAVARISFIILGFSLVLAAIGIYYYLFTGNFFFKFVQINNSDYRNTLNQGF